MIREVLRRVRNFLVGPRLRFRHYKTSWHFQLIPWFRPLRWWSSEGYHFTEIMLIEFYVWHHVWGVYWSDNN